MIDQPTAKPAQIPMLESLFSHDFHVGQPCFHDNPQPLPTLITYHSRVPLR